MSLVHCKARGKGERRIRIEGLLAAGVAPSDIAYVEGVSRQWVSQIQQALAEQALAARGEVSDNASVKSAMTVPRIGAYSRIPCPQGHRRRMSRAFAAWLASQAQSEVRR